MRRGGAFLRKSELVTISPGSALHVRYADGICPAIPVCAVSVHAECNIGGVEQLRLIVFVSDPRSYYPRRLVVRIAIIHSDDILCFAAGVSNV